MSSIPFNADPESGLSKNYNPPKRSYNTSRTWTIGTFVCGFITAVVGGGLMGLYFHKAYKNCDDHPTHKLLGDDNIYDDVNNDSDKCVGPKGLFWGGIFCLIVAGILGMLFIFFLLAYCLNPGNRNSPGLVYQSVPSFMDQNSHSPRPYNPYAASSHHDVSAPPPSYAAVTAQSAQEYQSNIQSDAGAQIQSNVPIVQVNGQEPPPSELDQEQASSHPSPTIQPPSSPRRGAPPRFY